MRSVSTNYSRNLQQKVSCFFFHIFLSLIVSSWRHGLQMANEADEAASLNKLQQLKTLENVRKKMQSENVES